MQCIMLTEKLMVINLTFLARLLVSGAESPGDIHQAEVCDDCSSVLEEDVLGLQILVDNALVVEVAHALCDLLCDQDHFVHEELVFA